jgi:hypothetical protein
LWHKIRKNNDALSCMLHSHCSESPDAPLEEPPAPVAGGDPVVLPARLVPAHLAQHVNLLVHPAAKRKEENSAEITVIDVNGGGSDVVDRAFRWIFHELQPST